MSAVHVKIEEKKQKNVFTNQICGQQCYG